MEENIQGTESGGDEQKLTGWEDMFDTDGLYENREHRLVAPDKLKEAFKETIKEIVNKVNKAYPIEVPISSSERLQQAISLNRYGLCPHCKSDWDGGDIFEELCKKEVLILQGDVAKVAAMYGWTKDNKKRFSSVIGHTIQDKDYTECPHCHHVFEQETSKEYKSLFDLKLQRTTPTSIANLEEEVFNPDMNEIDDDDALF